MARAGSSGSSPTSRDVSTYFTPLAICLNINSFEHLEFETRPDQLLSTRWSRATSGSSSSSRRSAGRRGRVAVRAAQLEFDTATTSRWSCSASTPTRTNSRPEAGRPGRRGSPRRRGRLHERGIGAVERRGGCRRATEEGGGERHRVDAIACRYLQVRRARHQPRHGGRGRPDHVHGHGLHHLRERRASSAPGSSSTRRASRSVVGRGTALIAGIMTIAMGVFANYPFALAAGLGINAIVAFTLTAKGLSPAGAMGVIVIEGVARHDPRPGRASRSDHERRPAGAEAGDRRRHRPVHPVHRLRQRRAHRRRRPAAAPVRSVPCLPDDARPVRASSLGLAITIVL